MASVRFKKHFPFQYDENGGKERWIHSFSPAGAKAITEQSFGLSGTGVYALVSRQALVAAGDKFTHKFQVPAVPGNAFYCYFGVSLSPEEPNAQENIDYRVNGFGGVTGAGVYTATASSLASTFTWEKTTATTLVLRENGAIIATWTVAAGAPLYLSGRVEINVKPTGHGGFVDATFAGTGLTGLPAAPNAPTIAVTKGHRRNHVSISNFGGGNGVSIYRATAPGAQNFDVPLITEWRYPVFEDKTAANDTTYYYVARSTKNGLSESASSGEVSAKPEAGSIPAMTPEIAFIIGAPALAPIGDATPETDLARYNHDEFQEWSVFRWGLIIPKRSPFDAIAGTVSVTNGSKTITGFGTQFLADYRADGNITVGGSVYTVYWVESDTVLHLWNAYGGSTASGLAHRPTTRQVDPQNADLANQTYYYDTGLSLYNLYYRTGNPYVLQLAREAVVMWRTFIEQESTQVYGGAEFVENPRAISLFGVAIYALEQNNAAFWATVKKHADTEHGWLTQPIQNQQFGSDSRERAYMIQYASILGRCHPDPAVRSNYTNLAISWYLGFFKWQMDKYADGQYRFEIYYTTDDNYYAYHYHQPFIDAIFGECAVMVHKLATQINSPDKAAIEASYLKWVDAAMGDWDNRLMQGTVEGKTWNYRLRNIPYSLCSFITENGIDKTFEQAYAAIPPYNVAHDVTGQMFRQLNLSEPLAPLTYSEKTRNGHPRSNNPIYLCNFGYPWHITGNTKYKNHGNDVLDATYADTDELFGCRSVITFSGKNTNEAFRRSPTFVGYRDAVAPLSGGGSPPPPPPPPPPAGGTAQIICAGDSRTSGFQYGDSRDFSRVNSYPHKLALLLGADSKYNSAVTNVPGDNTTLVNTQSDVIGYPAANRAILVRNEGVSGSTYDANQTARYPGDIKAFYDTTRTKNIVIFAGGINDILLGNASVAYVRSKLKPLIDDARASGFIVGVATIPLRNGGSVNLPTITEYNNSIRADKATADFLVDFAADARLQNPNDATYFYDGLHLTPAGNDVLAAIAKAALAPYVTVEDDPPPPPPLGTGKKRVTTWRLGLVIAEF